MTEELWRELEYLNPKNPTQEDRFNELFDLTIYENNHPEWYMGACCCKDCASYGE